MHMETTKAPRIVVPAVAVRKVKLQ